MPGHFIVLEGPDGSGTTTHAALLGEKLGRIGHDVLLTAEPTTGAIGTFIREQLKKKSIDSPSALQLLFCADRAAHIETVIKPALAAGKTVISDRYVISTLVYGEALGLRRDWLLTVNTPFLEPDIMIVALPEFRACLERINKRKTLDVFENMPFQRKIYDLYERVTVEDPSVLRVDTSGSVETVSSSLFEHVRRRLT